MKKIATIVFAFVIVMSACNNPTSTKPITTAADTAKEKKLIPDAGAYRQNINGKPTGLYILKNSNNMQVAITNYGGRIVSIVVPDKNGKPANVVIGFDSVQQFQSSTEPYFGALIGRFGNRIAKGTFTLDGKTYQLFKNNGPNTLHGGKNGFQYAVWDATPIGDSALQLTYLSKDGEENFPGNLTVKVVYTVTAANELKIEYEASTDKKTVINLTSHAFFNLNGAGSGTINNHSLQINANEYTPVDSTLIPTGTIEKVAGTPFDFTTAHTIGARINDSNMQLKYGKGYDHNFVLNRQSKNDLEYAATATGDISGITMAVLTTEPGLQFYGGNFMQGKNKMMGYKDDFRTAFCLETQHYPDAPNQPNFPSTVLERGKKYTSVTVYKFSVKQ